MHAERAHRNVVDGTFVNRRCRVERGPAFPLFGEPRVTRLGQRALAEVGADPKRVLVFPADPGFRLGNEEAAVDEVLGHGVELASHRGIGAAARQGHHAVAVFRSQATRALPHPVLALRIGQRIQVENDLPRGRFLDVLVEERAAPDAAHVILVLPVVVDPRPADAGTGDAVPRRVDLEQLFVEFGEPRNRFEFGDGRVRPLLGPGKSLFAFDLLEPEVGILVLRCRDRSGEQNDQGKCQKPSLHGESSSSLSSEILCAARNNLI